MNAILNREYEHPADGWYHIEAKGEHLNRRAAIHQVIDDVAIQSIVNNFNADAAAGRLSHGREMLIDQEHFSANPEKESRAYGWLQELQARADGIYGRIRWSVTGQAAVDGGDYRFFSTEYEPNEAQTLGRGKIRPLRLAGLTLTNTPNNKGQHGITNRRATADSILNMHRKELETETARLVSTYNLSEREARVKAAWITNRELLEIMDARTLANHFSALTNRYKDANRTTFENAWRRVAGLEPALYRAMHESQ